MKQQQPEKMGKADDANLRKPTEENVARNNDGTPAQNKEDIHPNSELSNNLSNDKSGSTQYVNADTHLVPPGNGELPDSENTVDRPNPTAETHLENNEPLDKTGEDDAIPQEED